MSTTRVFGPVTEAEAGGRTLPTVNTNCPWCGDFVGDAEVCESCGKSVADTRPGSILVGRYRIESLLGRGGMGSVYRGRHLALDEAVAVKFLLASWISSPQQRARFKREAVALARLRHPGIVSVLDFGETDDGTPYIVMELIKGKALADVMRDAGGLLPPARVVGIIDQILDVLVAAHTAGIVHRDLKPENVMLLDTHDDQDRVKVLDFGLALMDDQGGGQRLTEANAVSGTPLYMAPEQARGRDMGPATDVYAIGVVLYEMLTGVPPFRSSTAAETLAQHIYTLPPPMAERAPQHPVSPALEAVTRRALAKKPEQRPDAAAMRELLSRALRGTDDTSKAAAIAVERARVGGLSREERALSPQELSGERTAPALPPVKHVAPGDDAPCVVLWGLSPERIDGLRTTLGVHGLNAVVRNADAPLLREGDDVRVVITAGDGGVERTKSVRADARTAKLPVLVLDVGRPDENAALIRAGANDVASRSSSDAAIVQLVTRLIRRGR